MILTRKYFNLIVIQCIAETILLFGGRQLLILFIERNKKADWMWVFEMKLFLAVFAFVTLVGDAFYLMKPKWFYKVVLIQFLVLFLYLLNGFSIRPYRTLFLILTVFSVHLLKVILIKNKKFHVKHYKPEFDY